jgi:NADH-quinone oxidoreductase subunit J
MLVVFLSASVLSVIAALLTITRSNVIHGLLFLVLSQLASAVVLFTLGAPLVAALEIIVYAGAIIVLFVFAVMLLNQGERAVALERSRMSPGVWAIASVIASVLVVELAFVLWKGLGTTQARAAVGPTQVGVALFGRYEPGVELASVLLLSGLVGAFHLGRKTSRFARQ